MHKSLFLSAFVGGIIAFIWGFISWAVIPWHMATMNYFQDPAAVSEVLQQNAPVDGVYLYHPMETQSDGMPFVFATVNRAHAKEMQVYPLVRSFIIQIIAAFFISWVLVHGKSRRYWDLVTVSAVLGLIGGILAYLPAWNWWGTTAGYTIVGILDLVITWFLAGLVMARIVEKVKVPK